MALRDGFLKAVQSAAREHRVPLEKGFIHWYVNVALGTDVKRIVTDGPSDGGIDAIVWIPRPRGNFLIYVLQSKYTQAFFSAQQSSALNIAAHESLDKLPATFENDNKFADWLLTVEESLRKHYKQLREQIQKEGNRVEWRLFTLHSRSRAGENRLIRLPPDSFVYGASVLELYAMDLEGATPPGDPLEISFTEGMVVEENRLGYKSWVIAARVRDYLDYLEGDPEGRLFARNVRLDLGSEINENIRETFEESPAEFWYSHNGITITCSSATAPGKKLRLINPSVINGSQTLHSLAKAKKKDPDALVLTRVLEIPFTSAQDKETKEKKRFLSDIIFRTNQQNRMYAWNLRANDVIQVDLAKKFIRERVFYERRPGEWKKRKRVLRNEGLEKLEITQLGILLAAFNPAIGVAEAKKSKEDIFTKHYDDIFYQPFAEMMLQYRIYRFVEDELYYMTHRGTDPRQRRHTLLTAGAVLWDILRSSPSFGDFRSSTQRAEMLDYDFPQTKDLRTVVKGIFVDMWGSWRSANKKDPTVSPNNFFKSERINRQVRTTVTRRFRRTGFRAFAKIVPSG